MKKLAWLLPLAFATTSLQAADLLQIYRTAKENDATFAVAAANRDAGVEKKAQGLSGLLPSISASGNSNWNKVDVEARGVSATSKYNYNSNAYSVSLTQPLFRWQNWASYGQGKLQAAQAEATFIQAKQDLILRVVQAYIDVLYGQENLAAAQANRAAIAQQLEQAKKNFEVGTATITDTHEAQARYDLASAQEIAAESDLEVKRRTLQSIVGKDPGPIAQLRNGVALQPPQPASMDPWVTSAEQNAISVQIQRAALEIADKEVGKQRAGHLPTVDLVANVGKSRSLSVGTLVDTNSNSVGVQVNIPLFQGGYVMSKDREAVANRRAAESGLEAAKRAAVLAARQYYLGAVNGLAQIKALEAGLRSSRLALESNKLGYEVGVRINIDVLNAEQQVFSTRRDLAKSMYDTVLALLRLKAAVGTLSDEDVEQYNALLDPSNVK